MFWKPQLHMRFMTEYADACDAFAQACTTQWLIASEEDSGYDVFEPGGWIEFSRATVQRCDSQFNIDIHKCSPRIAQWVRGAQVTIDRASIARDHVYAGCLGARYDHQVQFVRGCR